MHLKAHSLIRSGKACILHVFLSMMVVNLCLTPFITHATTYTSNSERNPLMSLSKDSPKYTVINKLWQQKDTFQDDIIPFEYLVKTQKIISSNTFNTDKRINYDINNEEKEVKLITTDEEIKTQIIADIKENKDVLPSALGIEKDTELTDETIANIGSNIILEKLKTEYGTTNVFPNRKVTTRQVSENYFNDPLYDTLWGIKNEGQTHPLDTVSESNSLIAGEDTGIAGFDMKIEEFWSKDQSNGGENTVIAVTDTGVDYTHPDIENNIAINQGEINSELKTLIDTNLDEKVDSREILQYLRENNLDINSDSNINLEDILAPASPFIDSQDSDNNGYVDDIMGWNFLTNTNNPMDEDGHGTHVAGTIAAEANNGIGIAGIAYNAEILPIAMIGNNSDLPVIISSLEYTMGKASVVNMSWGGRDSRTEQETIGDPGYEILDELKNEGITLINAAGNTGTIAAFGFPTKSKSVISVGSTNSHGKKSEFSSIGSRVDVSAPGEGIVSLKSKNASSFYDGVTMDTDYMVISGTSMASPQIAGVVGIIKANNPELSFEQIRSILRNNGRSDFNHRQSLLKGYSDFEADKIYNENNELVDEIIDNYPIISITNPDNLEIINKSFDVLTSSNRMEDVSFLSIEMLEITESDVITPDFEENWVELSNSSELLDYTITNLTNNSVYIFRATGQFGDHVIADSIDTLARYIDNNASNNLFVTNPTNNYPLKGYISPDFQNQQLTNKAIDINSSEEILLPDSVTCIEDENLHTCPKNVLSNIDISILPVGIYKIISNLAVAPNIEFVGYVQIVDNQTIINADSYPSEKISQIFGDIDESDGDEMIMVHPDTELYNPTADAFFGFNSNPKSIQFDVISMDGDLQATQAYTIPTLQGNDDYRLIDFSTKPLLHKINGQNIVLFKTAEFKPPFASNSGTLHDESMYNYREVIHAVDMTTGESIEHFPIILEQNSIPIDNNDILYFPIPHLFTQSLIIGDDNGVTKIFDSNQFGQINTILFDGSTEKINLLDYEASFSLEQRLFNNIIVENIDNDNNLEIIASFNDKIFSIDSSTSGYHVQKIYEQPLSSFVDEQIPQITLSKSHSITSLLLTDLEGDNIPNIVFEEYAQTSVAYADEAIQDDPAFLEYPDESYTVHLKSISINGQETSAPLMLNEYNNIDFTTFSPSTKYLDSLQLVDIDGDGYKNFIFKDIVPENKFIDTENGTYFLNKTRIRIFNFDGESWNNTHTREFEQEFPETIPYEVSSPEFIYWLNLLQSHEIEDIQYIDRDNDGNIEIIATTNIGHMIFDSNLNTIDEFVSNEYFSNIRVASDLPPSELVTTPQGVYLVHPFIAYNAFNPLLVPEGLRDAQNTINTYISIQKLNDTSTIPSELTYTFGDKNNNNSDFTINTNLLLIKDIQQDGYPAQSFPVLKTQKNTRVNLNEISSIQPNQRVQLHYNNQLVADLRYDDIVNNTEPYFEFITGMDTGYIEIKVTYLDENGVEMTQEIKTLLVVDNTVPSVFISSLSYTNTYRGDEPVTVGVYSDDVDGTIASLEIYLNNELVQSIENPEIDEIISVDYIPEICIEAGNIELYAVATDNDGAQSQSEIITLTPDETYFNEENCHSQNSSSSSISSSETSSSSLASSETSSTNSNSSESSSMESSQVSNSVTSSSISSSEINSSITESSSSETSNSSLTSSESSSMESSQVSNSVTSSSISSSESSQLSSSVSNSSSSYNSSAIVSSAISNSSISTNSLSSSGISSTTPQKEFTITNDACTLTDSLTYSANSEQSNVQIETISQDQALTGLIGDFVEGCRMTGMDSSNPIGRMKIRFSVPVNSIPAGKNIAILYSNSPWKEAQVRLIKTENGMNYYEVEFESGFRQIAMVYKDINNTPISNLIRSGSSITFGIAFMGLLFCIVMIYAYHKAHHKSK